MPLMEVNVSPLEDRLQQFQLYAGGNIGNDYGSHGNVPITTSASPTLSPTPSAPITPLFGNMPNSPLTGLTPDKLSILNNINYSSRYNSQTPCRYNNNLNTFQCIDQC